MGSAIPARGETNFAAAKDAKIQWSAGEGVVMRFKHTDLKRLDADLGPEYFNAYVEQCQTGVIPFNSYEIFLKHGVKKDGVPYVIPEEILDEIPYHDGCEIILEALVRSIKGKSAKEYFEVMAQAYLAAVNGGSFPPQSSPDTTTSTISESGVSGLESESKNSGK